MRLNKNVILSIVALPFCAALIGCAATTEQSPPMVVQPATRLGPVVKAPVYKDGDWWIFRRKEDGKPPWNARVTYKDGKFESDDPAFLEGQNINGAPQFLAFASVYLNDPQKKPLDFPLVPGKKWTFRYTSDGFNFRRKWREAKAEAVGAAAQPMKTPAGSFNGIKIRRTDWGGNGFADLTYYYSPETKSIVKHIADDNDRHGFKRRYEMELIEYSVQ